MSETDVKRRIMKALDALGFRVVRVQSGKAKVRGGWMQLAEKGTPDLLVVAPYGWLEVKVPGEEPSDDQLEWHAWARENGVRVVTVDGAQDATAAVLGWREEQRFAERMGWTKESA